MLHYDPYDSDRIWVSHPEDGSLIECVARGVRLSTLPFGGSMVEALRAMPEADTGIQDEWAVEHLVAADERREAMKGARRKAGRSKSEAGKPDSRASRKAASKKTRRDADDMPKPEPVKLTPLPPPPTTGIRPGDYAVGDYVEDLWNV